MSGLHAVEGLGSERSTEPHTPWESLGSRFYLDNYTVVW